MTRRRWWALAITLVVVLVLAGLTFAARIPFTSEALRSRMVSTLAERLDADVDLGTVQLRLLPRLRAEGHNLLIKYRRRPEAPPLISVRSFSVEADLLALWRRHVTYARLEGLQIQISPNPERRTATKTETESGNTRDRGPHLIQGPELVIDSLDCPEAQLIIYPRNPDKPPRIWQLHTLQLTSMSTTSSMPFEATLTNAVPPGYINTEGFFGPWHRDDPGHTPVSGKFVFERADLSVFKGISGTLAAKGTYDGSLENLDVKGETTTPDFTIKLGQPVGLKTKYEAVVDATNGDTVLKRIDASFLNTVLLAEGAIVGVKGVKGRLVTLNLVVERGRIEDLMKLAIKTRPPMTGGLMLATKLDLPPGDEDLVDKLRLSGQFAISSGRFTDTDVQKKIVELSRRASGRKKDDAPVRVVSDFSGRFALNRGMLTLPRLTFDVPGAIVELNGHYGLRRETLGFTGNLFMDAKLSETTSGFKSLLLKVVDPLFRRNGRTVIPIKVTGVRSDPSFGVDTKRVVNFK